MIEKNQRKTDAPNHIKNQHKGKAMTPEQQEVNNLSYVENQLLKYL